MFILFSTLSPRAPFVNLYQAFWALVFFLAEKVDKLDRQYYTEHMAQLKRNNQIAHPNKFDRYFQQDVDCLAYKTADIKNVIYNSDEDEIVDFLLRQEKSGTSYELLEDIHARVSELSDVRTKVISWQQLLVYLDWVMND